MTTNMTCGTCGVAYCMPTVLYNERRKDGETFYCPNGHPRVFRPTEHEKRIAELEREVRTWEENEKWTGQLLDERYAAIEELVAAVKACPYGCGFRSRRQVPRDPVAMGRGLERVERDLGAHLIEVHGAHPVPDREPLLLPERT